MENKMEKTKSKQQKKDRRSIIDFNYDANGGEDRRSVPVFLGKK
jgi:hypothetical protein